MAGVYSPTTAPNPKASCWTVPSDLLDMKRFILKGLEVLLAFVAFVLEETVSSCVSCGSLYFFEFVSCTAFLFTALLLLLLSTTLSKKVGISCWPTVDFLYSALMVLLFLISSIVFSASNSDQTVEKVAVVFGFLATVAFVIDVVFFLKSNGFPLRQRPAPTSSNGPVPQPEVERLNEPNGAP